MANLSPASYPQTASERLQEATERELLDELARRRREAIQRCTDAEIEAELTKRGVDRGDRPPKLVEK